MSETTNSTLAVGSAERKMTPYEKALEAQVREDQEALEASQRALREHRILHDA